MDIELFNFLRKLIETEDGLILYALALAFYQNTH